jgi:predicted metal-dependent HD superfamily phosphohydrolase
VQLQAQARFVALGERLGLAPGASEPLLQELVARYGERHRRYHTLAHVLDCLERLDDARAEPADPESVELALWFHDVVYDPKADDNETRSAVIARERLAAAGVAAPICGRVIELVLSTADPASASPGDAALVCDIDDSILGRPAAEYDAYRRAVREELAFVPDDRFAAGRGRFLEGWLARPRLFHTDTFRDRYEAAARDNMARELAELRAGKGV